MSAMPLRAPRPSGNAGLRWRPRLRLVRAPAPARSRLLFLLLCVGILGGAMLGALALNTAMATTAYVLRERQVELARLTESEQQLTATVEQLSSPAQLANQAQRLGMVPAEGLSYIDLETGTISGPAAALVGEGDG
ncbi:MAG TPA: hypothetical protein VKY71_13845 [Actinotalea caeni]|uniref:hypothetical protein n=1 Tax=Actinotalea caeni TaxID=1348467 RepID=UPI0012E2A0A7|nr:hypothetical protein [Actinotalea caeni]HLV56647.1 hypothetical protein [Actinotalea caeni]